MQFAIRIVAANIIDVFKLLAYFLEVENA